MNNQVIEEISKKYFIPSLSIAIAQDDGLIACIPKDRTDAVFPLYSITKTYISVLLLQLAEQNKINLDKELAHWIPDAPEARRYSLRQLLNNSSGLPDYFSAAYVQAVQNNPSVAWSRAEFIQSYPGKLLFEPGKGWAYSNLGYMFLREVIEKVTQMSFSEALQENIFLPLDLKTSLVLCQPSDCINLVAATSRDLRLDGSAKDFVGNYHPGWVGHGLIASSAGDVAKFFYQLFSGKLIGQKLLNEMKILIRVPGEHPPAVTPSYGLGIMADPDSLYGIHYGHSGGGPGYALRASCWETGKGRTVIVALGNNEKANVSLLMLDLVRSL